MGSIAVRYLIRRLLFRPYILECTTQVLVRCGITLEFEFEFQVHLSSSWRSHVVYLHHTVVHLTLQVSCSNCHVLHTYVCL